MLIFASSIIFRKCFVCLDYASFIKQFRAVGRCAWAYYYIATVSAVVVLYRWYVALPSRSKNISAYIVAILFFILWLFEAEPFAAKTRTMAQQGLESYNIQYKSSATSWEGFLEQNGYRKDSFQAMLVLPYVHIGTEKLGVNAGYNHILAGAFHASLELHLPIADVMMSRTSWSQAFAQVKIAGGAYTEKQLLHTSDKPLLILYPESIVPDRYEWYLLDAARSLGNQQGYDVYALYPGELRLKEKKHRDSLNRIFELLPPVDTCLNDCGMWAVEHYDNGTATQKLFGKGADKAIKGNSAIVFNEPVTPAYDKQEYEFSAWTLVSDKDYKIGRFRVLGFDSDENLVVDETVLVQESVDNEGLWLRANKYFLVPEGCERIEVELINIINPAYIALDEMMIRPADAVIMSKQQDGTGMVNNHMFR